MWPEPQFYRALSALLSQDEPLSRAFDGELAAFFEQWLYTVKPW